MAGVLMATGGAAATAQTTPTGDELGSDPDGFT